MSIAFKDEKLDQASTDSFASIVKAKTDGLLLSIVIANLDGANQLSYQVLGSNDPEGAVGTFATEKASADLAASTLAAYLTTNRYMWVDVQIKEKVALQSPHSSCWVLGIVKP